MQAHTKQSVRQSFNRAATSYDAAAVVQKEVCEQLLARLDYQIPPKQARILDAGCGTGFGARLLQARWPDAQLTLLDFAPAMLAHTLGTGKYRCVADIEALPFANASFNLWWSSLTIQWCNTRHVFKEAHRVLMPDGLLAVSTLGAGTFAELRKAFSAVDAYQHTLNFTTPEEISDALYQLGLKNIHIQRTTSTLHYPDLKTLLRAVKAVGANQVTAGGRSTLMGRTSWQNLETAFERMRTPQGLPLSYDVLMAYATKNT